MPDAAAATISAVHFAPLLPMWAMAALAIAALGLLALGLRTRARGTPLRALAAAAVLLWLAGPELVRETRLPQRDIALLVTDQTASMKLNERAALTDAAATRLARAAGALPNLDLRTVPITDQPTGTRLFETIDRALADLPRDRLAGIIVLTDGQVHDRPASADAAALPAPLHVLIPARGEETERRVRIIEAPAFGVVGKSVTLRVVVEDLGVHPAASGETATAPARTVRLVMHRDGEAAGERQVVLGETVSIPLPITHAGLSVVALQADPLPGAVSVRNDQAVLTIQGVRDRLRVLLISGEPYPGERTWRRLLKADPAVDLVHFTILRPPNHDDRTPLNELALIAFPVNELFQAKLRDFDLIVLDRFQNRGLLPVPYLRNIAEYVQDGGALLISTGPEFANSGSLAFGPLGAVIPARPAGVRNGPFRPLVSPLGQRHPVTAGLDGANDGPSSAGSGASSGVDGASGAPSWGSWYRHLDVTDVSGTAVMTDGAGEPLLLLARYGRGRSALLLSDQIWLWSRGHDGGGPQAELLRRLAHWLLGEPALEEEQLTATSAAGTLSLTRRSLGTAPPEPFIVTAPDGTQSTVPATPGPAPGTTTARVAAPSPGVWRVDQGGLTAFAAIGDDNAIEFAELRATATLLAPITRASGGSIRFIGPAAANGPPIVPTLRRVNETGLAAGDGWIGLRARGHTVLLGRVTTALAPAWMVLGVLLGLIVFAWRRESG